MGRCQCNPQRPIGGLAGQHHHDARRSGALGQVFGVAGKRNARVVDDALLHRRCDDCIVFTGHRTADRPIERRQNVMSVTRIAPARQSSSAQRHVLPFCSAWPAGADKACAFRKQRFVADQRDVRITGNSV